MNAELITALKELAREKGIPFETILSGLEEAMASAYKSWRRQQDPELTEEGFGSRAQLDPETGEMRMWEQTLDEEGTVTEEHEVEVTDEFKGRIGAQTAKQVIYQKLRDAERELTYEEFAGREGDIVTGIIQQDSHRYTLLDLGKVEALLPQAEQVPSEPYRHGDRLTAYITEVRRGTKGPQIVVSRTHPGLLRKLFELEVPEIQEGIVEIKAVAREPGHRSKIAVSSNEPGADPATYVANALQPAKVKEVRIDTDTQTASVIVPDYQLSLAIGKEGQNARLAARLTGWRIDIRSETQFAEEQRGGGPASTPVVPDATEPAVPEAAPEMAAEAGAPTVEPQPGPTGDAEVGEPAAEEPEPTEGPTEEAAAAE